MGKQIFYYREVGALWPKIIAGKKYASYCETKSKETAKKIAQKIREMGLSARVVPTKVDTYEVYVPLKQYKKVMKKTIRGGKARKKKSRKKRKRR